MNDRERIENILKVIFLDESLTGRVYDYPDNVVFTLSELYAANKAYLALLDKIAEIAHDPIDLGSSSKDAFKMREALKKIMLLVHSPWTQSKKG